MRFVLAAVISALLLTAAHQSTAPPLDLTTPTNAITQCAALVTLLPAESLTIKVYSADLWEPIVIDDVVEAVMPEAAPTDRVGAHRLSDVENYAKTHLLDEVPSRCSDLRARFEDA
jgi:hypothetical protein